VSLIYCSECGKQISDKAPSCPGCGAPSSHRAQGEVAVRPIKSRSAAILLALFLGGLGMHKFYLGSPGAGATYLLFCWTGVPMILGFIEAISMLFTSDANFHKKYG
jgi:TM2 domain-containing membrane protein YozV